MITVPKTTSGNTSVDVARAIAKALRGKGHRARMRRVREPVLLMPGWVEEHGVVTITAEARKK